MARSDTLCWDCVHAAHNKCSWARSFVPVEGWVADKTVVAKQSVRSPESESYIVRSCPQFERDKKNISDIDDVAADRLIHDIIAYAIREWKKAVGTLNGGRFRNDANGQLITEEDAKRMLVELTDFFKSAWFATLTGNCIDSERLLSALRKNEVPTVAMLTKGGF